MAYSFNFVQIADNGPNNGYQYVTSVSDSSGSQPTKFEYIVVSDLLNNSSTFYTSQCGTFSASNSSGFIAGSQLSLNVFDHEQGSVLSHWTEYRDAQDNPNNNIGSAMEPIIGVPGTPSNTYSNNVNTAAQNALNTIAQAVAVEPCGGLVNQDSSQACESCGNVNYSPYQSFGGQHRYSFQARAARRYRVADVRRSGAAFSNYRIAEKYALLFVVRRRRVNIRAFTRRRAATVRGHILAQHVKQGCGNRQYDWAHEQSQHT
jgi:hypothetical protein